MSFKALISSSNKQFIWSRVIQTLSSINESIRFTITSDELILWSMNSTDTTMCEIRLEAEFFDEYSFEPGLIVFGEEGVQNFKDLRGVEHKMYSFQINGRHLSILSRKPDNDNIKEFMLVIDNTTICPEAVANRLQIRIYTEALMTKEFNPGFQPIKYDPVVIDLKYKKKFLDVYAASAETQTSDTLDPRLIDYFGTVRKQLDQAKFNQGIVDIVRPKELLPADEINFISMDGLIWKNFIDTCNNITEEIRLDLNENKMIITAFTRGVYNLKTQDVLKQAVSISNSVNANDLEHYCLFTTSQEQHKYGRDGPTKRTVFKLKDFKNFFNANQAWKDHSVVNCWFCLPGDPIVFEMDRTGVKLSLIQITDNNANYEPSVKDTVIHPIMRSPKKTHSPLKAANPWKKTVQPIEKTSFEPPVLKTADSIKKLFVQESQLSDQPFNLSQNNPTNGSNPMRHNYDNHNVHIDINDLPCPNDGLDGNVEHRNDRSGTVIAWGATEVREPSPVTDQKTMLQKEKLKYLANLKRRKLENGKFEPGEQDEAQSNEAHGAGWIWSYSTISTRGLFG
ncbi:Ddc1p Ecym_2218 [Eremothecium cymbalariae DBVPG|uniref:DNA damage checkpoint protein 1 n=1 Tax=Eremothecium cymbalariae (strain CBS 270.75 / DBVPG 7215 / KCTC 17166 / NRRL Y-17582) TaxID=931890 RepID=G8JP62_ERECY|nr:Hypothetical protein Ecym_2218 [Eremothecium cymbalariae DBVPG\